MSVREDHCLGTPLPQRIAVIRALRGLGDILCAVPALRALRAALPQAQIALIGLPEVAHLVQRFKHYIDELVEFPGYPGIPERPFQPKRFSNDLLNIQQRRFDLVLQLHGSGAIINHFTALVGAERIAGFYLPGHYRPDSERFLLYPAHEPEVRRMLRLLEFLGVAAVGEQLEFPLQEEDLRELRLLEEATGLRPGSYLCIHPGASDPQRRWRPAYFAAVAEQLAQHGWQIVLTGTAGEAELTAAVAQGMSSPALDLAGKTNLGTLAALLAQARLLISNDTGVAHLAAALNVPSVVVFSASDPDRWAPLARNRHRIVGQPLLDSGCSHLGCRSDHCCVGYGCNWRGSQVAPARRAATPGIVVEYASELLEENAIVAAPLRRETSYAG